MANLADTTYIFSGNEKDINLIALAFENAQTIYEALSKLDNNFQSSDKFLGEIVWAAPMKDGSYIIYTSTKWSRCIEIEETVLSYLPDVSIFYEEEEFGCGIFRTNDSTGEIFPDRFYVELDGEGEYCKNEKEVLEYLSESFDAQHKPHFENIKEAITFAEKSDYLLTILEIEVE